MSTALAFPAAPDVFADALAAAVTPATYLDAAHRWIVHAATLAPSVHNSQPWTFTKDDGGLDLHADADRRLPVLDPEGRLVHLSCGAALQNAQVAARALGFDAEPVLLPDSADPGHLARLRLTAGAPGSAEDHALASAIPLRHTHRDAFEQRTVPPAVLEELRLAAEEHGAVLTTVSGDALIELEVLLAWADGVEEAVPGYRAETTVVLLVSEHDSPLSWLRAGQALGAVLLHAAGQGVMGQPLAQATDFPAARVRLRAALGLVGTPQMALRLGYAAGTAATPRRDVDDVPSPAGTPGALDA